MTKLLIVQPYVPTYRVPFFRYLTARLADLGVAVTLAGAAPDGSGPPRDDAAGDIAVVNAPTRSVSVGGRALRWQATWGLVRRHDAVVYEASGALLDVSIALQRGASVALWGHIGSYVRPAHWLDRKVEHWQLLKAAAVLAYTPAGRDFAIGQGVPPAKAVALYNTVDTRALVAAVDATTRSTADAVLGTVGWRQSRTLCFVGQLDESKRIEFLAASLDLLWTTHPDVRILVAGQGRESYRLASAVDRGQVRLIGRVDDLGKAALARVAAAILMPGRVGLIAVESLAMRLPILTTNWPFHAPEMEYLTPGVNVSVSDDSLEAYVASVRRAVDHPDELDKLRLDAISRAHLPTIEDMTDNFVHGIRTLLPGLADQ